MGAVAQRSAADSGPKGWGSRAVRFGQGLIENLRLYRRGLGLVLGTARAPSIASFVLMMILNLAMVVQIWLAKLVVDQLTLVVGGHPEAIGTALPLAALCAVTLALPVVFSRSSRRSGRRSRIEPSPRSTDA